MNDVGLVARWSMLVLTALVLQVGVVPQFPVAGVVADLMLLVAIAAGVVGGPERGAVMGFVCGFVFDLTRPGPLGLSALAYTLAAAGAGGVMVQILQARRLLTVAVVATATAVGTLLFAVGSQLFGQHTLENPRLWTIVSVVTLLNGLLALPAVRASRWAEGTPPPPLGVVDV
jgi:rod shape-determining protein MreD